MNDIRKLFQKYILESRCVVRGRGFGMKDLVILVADKNREYVSTEPEIFRYFRISNQKWGNHKGLPLHGIA
ncbi:MAG: hypothetical protein DRR00_27320 [Candidatus Parabeggiatoa sp. nov. 3]|nr:MAG: hypothetical protein DRR00_27320 [Gammaproteobacteria bacterium]